MSTLDKLAKSAGTCIDGDGHVATEPFLATCTLVLPVIEQMGTGMALVKSDVSGNIERLRTRYATDPAAFKCINTIVLREVAAGQHTGSSSCTKGLLWLKRYAGPHHDAGLRTITLRAMEFLVGILDGLPAAPTMHTAVSAAYDNTLKQFHGFFVYGTFKVALNLVPTKESFLQCVAPGPQDQQTAQLQQAVRAFRPVLHAVHAFLDKEGLDDPTPV